MNSEHVQYVLNAIAWFILGAVAESLRSWWVTRRRAGKPTETRLDRFTYGIVVMVTLAGVAFSISTELRADSSASCVNNVLGQRNGTSTSDSDAQLSITAAQLRFGNDLLAAFRGDLTAAELQGRVVAYRDAVADNRQVLAANKAYRIAHPFGRC